MHETRAVAEVVRVAEVAARGRPIRRLQVRIEGPSHLTPAVVRAHVSALAARSSPEMVVDVIVDAEAPVEGLRLVSVDVGES